MEEAADDDAALEAGLQMASKAIRTRNPRLKVLSIAGAESNRFTFTLPRAKGSQIAYALRGSIEYEMRADKPADRALTIVRAYGTAWLRGERHVEGAPQQMDFRLARPTRANLAGRSFTVPLGFTYPELLGLKKHQIVPRPPHAFGIRPVRASVKLHALWSNGFSGVLISGLGRIPMPTIAEAPLLAGYILACLCPPKKPKCKTLC